MARRIELDSLESTTLEVTITVSRKLRWRLMFFKWILKFAAWVGSFSNIEFIIEDEEKQDERTDT